MEQPQVEIGKANSTYLLPLSARSPEALRGLARAYRELLLRQESAASLQDLCYSASLRRSHYEYRLAVTGNSVGQLEEGLHAYQREEARAGLSHGHKAFRSAEKTGLGIFRTGLPMVWHGAAVAGAGGSLPRRRRTL
jgi:acyl transferase domain-containing protein